MLMPGGKKPGPSIKNPDMYEAMRKQHMPKAKAAAISNAAAAGTLKRAKGKRKS